MVNIDEIKDLVIDMKGLDKSFGNNKVLHNINFRGRAGEMVGLIGASGSGKSTLLRLIGGLISNYIFSIPEYNIDFP